MDNREILKTNTKISTIIAASALAGAAILLLMKKNSSISSSSGNSSNSKQNAFTPTAGYSNARGYRNNNPLNIRISNNAWQGKVPVEQNTDGSFEQFISMAYGFRAAMKNIRTIVNRGNNTIAKMIAVWAPDSDGNNSANYAKRVSNTTGYSTTATINPNNGEQMRNIAYAMAIVENGTAPKWEDVNAGWEMYNKTN